MCLTVDIDVLYCALFVTRARASAILGQVERATPLSRSRHSVCQVTLIILDCVRNVSVIVICHFVYH